MLFTSWGKREVLLLQKRPSSRPNCHRRTKFYKLSSDLETFSRLQLIQTNKRKPFTKILIIYYGFWTMCNSTPIVSHRLLVFLNFLFMLCLKCSSWVLQICSKIHSSRLMMNIYKTLFLNLRFYVFIWLHVYGVIKEYFKYIPSYLLQPFREYSNIVKIETL